jgi:hypothetical protein
VVICRVLTDVACELCDTYFRLQATLETAKEELTLRRFQTIHDMRKRRMRSAIAEMNEFIVDKPRIFNVSTLANVENTLYIIGCEPTLTIDLRVLLKASEKVPICLTDSQAYLISWSLKPFTSPQEYSYPGPL